MHLGMALAMTTMALLAPSMVVAPSHAAAAPGDAFSPDSATVFIAQGSPTVLYEAQTGGDGSFSFVPAGPAGDVLYNAVGFNPADNYLYGMAINSTPGIPAGSLVRVGEGNVVTRVGTQVYEHQVTTGSTTRWFSGAFNPDDGLYYISDSGPGRTVYGIDVTDGSIVEHVDLPVQPGIQDFAFVGGYIWGANNDGDLIRIDLDAATRTAFPGVLPTATGGYGAVWVFGNGNLGFSSNATGDVTQLRVSGDLGGTPDFAVISTVGGPSSTQNDGTSIPGLPADLGVTKTGGPTFVPGGSLTYTITVTNHGPGASSGWIVNDPLPAGLSNSVVTSDAQCAIVSGTLDCAGGRLAPGESSVITIVSDTDASLSGCFVNTVTVLGNEADPVAGNDSGSVTVCAAAPSIELEKRVSSVVDSNTNGLTDAGDLIFYEFEVRNLGNTELTGIRVEDDLLDAAGIGITCTPSALAVAQSVVCTADAPYVVTLDDVGAGEVANTAVAFGTPPGQPELPSPPSRITTPTDPQPGMAMVKRVAAVHDVNSNGSTDPGDRIEWEFEVTNTGNTMLFDIKVDDPWLADAGITVTCLPDQLLPGESVVCEAGLYTIVKADADRGMIQNVAVGHGTPPTGPPVVTPPSRTTTLISTGSQLVPTGFDPRGALAGGLLAALGLVLLAVNRARRI